MADRSKIEWTDATINPIRARRKDNGKVGWHCIKVSPECTHCYAESRNKRSGLDCGTGLPYTVASTDLVTMEFEEDVMLQVLRWKRPRKIFVCSMTDVFADFVPDLFIVHLWAYMASANHHTFQILTKRPERMHKLLNDPRFYAEVIQHFRDFKHFERPLPNVWLGVTTGDQEQANNRIPWLLRTPAAKRFISYEPALGPLRLWKLTALDFYNNTIGYETYPLDGMQAIPDCDWPHQKLDWVIAGAESGISARPAHPDWFRSVRDQCVKAGVPFFFKQWGEWAPITRTDGIHESPFGDYNIETKLGFMREGKHKAGALLDGQEWKQFPTMS